MFSRYFSTVGDEYKYSNAKKEIEYLIKLRGKPGIPQLYGFCIEENYIGWAVLREISFHVGKWRILTKQKEFL